VCVCAGDPHHRFSIVGGGPLYRYAPVPCSLSFQGVRVVKGRTLAQGESMQKADREITRTDREFLEKALGASFLLFPQWFVWGSSKWEEDRWQSVERQSSPGR
jgi:hypothetical protein